MATASKTYSGITIHTAAGIHPICNRYVSIISKWSSDGNYLLIVAPDSLICTGLNVGNGKVQYYGLLPVATNLPDGWYMMSDSDLGASYWIELKNRNALRKMIGLEPDEY